MLDNKNKYNKYRLSGFAKDPVCEFMDFFIGLCEWCVVTVGLFTAFMIIRDMWW